MFTYLDSFLFGASKPKSKRDSASIDTCTDFGKSKDRFGFDCGCLVLTYLDSISFGTSKQRLKRDSVSIDTCTDFEKSKERFGFDCGYLLLTYSDSFFLAQVNKSQSSIRHHLILVLVLESRKRDLVSIVVVWC